MALRPLAPLVPLAPLSQHVYHPSLLSSGPTGGTGDQGSGGDPNYTGGGPTYSGPPNVGQCLPGDYACLAGQGDPNCPPGEVTDANGFCVAPSGKTATGGQYAGGGGCSLLNPFTWTTSCLLRLVLLILGLILFGAGLWMLKPVQQVIKPVVKTVGKAAEIGAAA